MLKSMFLTKLKLRAVTLLATTILLGTGVLAHQVLAAKPAPPKTRTRVATREPRNAAEPEVAAPAQGRLEGRFTAADTGKPVAGAKIRVLMDGLPGKSRVAEGSTDKKASTSLSFPVFRSLLMEAFAYVNKQKNRLNFN